MDKEGVRTERPKVDITFYVPCYNEEAQICETLNTIFDAMRDFDLTYEVFVYDDASNDRSVEMVKQYIKENEVSSIVTLVTNVENQGIGINYFRAAEIGCGTYFMPLHGDNPLPGEELKKLINLIGKADIIVPYWGTQLFNIRYNSDHRNFLRRLFSVCYAFVVRLISGLDFHYFNGFVIHKRENVLKNKITAYGLGYQAELLCKIARDPEISYLEIKLHLHERTDRPSSALRLKNIISTTGSLWRIFKRRLILTC